MTKRLHPPPIFPISVSKFYVEFFPRDFGVNQIVRSIVNQRWKSMAM